MTRATPQLRLAFRPPFASDALLSFLAARAIPGVETVEGSSYRRSIRTRDGAAAVMALTPHPTDHHVTLEMSIVEIPELGGIVQAARRAFDLDADPAAVDELLVADRKLRPLVRTTPGMRLPGTVDGFELAVRAVLGQQVSVGAARTLAGRLTHRFGTPLARPAGEVTHLFPAPGELAEESMNGLGLTTGRVETIRRLAEMVAVGKLDLTGSADLGDTLAVLREIPGVGAWTAAYVAMRALRDPDAFPVGDLGIRRAFEALDLPSGPASIRARAERWRPWRAYAAMHLWQRST